MNLDQFLAVLSRRWRSAAATAALCFAVVVAVTMSLPSTYRATATLSVAQPGQKRALDSLLGEQLARTFATLGPSLTTARAVQARLTNGMSPRAILDRMSFTPIERTQLVQVSAEDHTALGAQRLANIYAKVYEQRSFVAYQNGQAQASVIVTDPASRPVSPIRPNPPLYILIGAMLSVMLGAAAALLRDRLEPRVISQEDDDVVLGLPVLARLPDMSSARGEALAAGSFGLLRSSIDFLSEGRAPQVIAVTSALPFEGKSVTTANLALAAVAAGERVAVVEADMRRPGLGYTELSSTVRRTGDGLAQLLVGDATLAELLRGTEELSVLWAGRDAGDPAVLLGSARFARVLADLRERFDRVIVDVPPVAAGADAMLVCDRCDAVLFVVDAERTRPADARTALARLRRAHAPLVGVAMNRSHETLMSEYYAAPAP